MKYKFTNQDRIKGAKRCHELHPDLARKNLAKVKTSKTQSILAKKARSYEKEKSKELSKKFDYIYYPTTVCDRIGVKKGKVYLIEIKKPGSKLTEEQAKIKRLLRKKYLVII